MLCRQNDDMFSDYNIALLIAFDNDFKHFHNCFDDEIAWYSCQNIYGGNVSNSKNTLVSLNMSFFYG